MKGELLLPRVHYGHNDFSTPPAILQEAFKCFEKASSLSSLALFLMGRWLITTHIIHNDAHKLRKGCLYVRDAARKACPRALRFVAHRYEYADLDALTKFRNLEKLPKSKISRQKFVVKHYKRAADMGDADALNDIATSHSEGYGGCVQDFDKAVDFYKRAITAGSVLGYDNLGTHYEYGMSNECPDRVDPVLAMTYYRRGARQRCPKAAFNLALAYQEGKLVKRDLRKAEKYFIYAMKIADDVQDFVIAGNCLRDVMAVLLTQLKMARPKSKEEKRVRRKIKLLLRNDDFIEKVYKRVDIACRSASRQENNELNELLYPENAQPIMDKLKMLMTAMAHRTATQADVETFNHICGYAPGHPHELQKSSLQGSDSEVEHIGRMSVASAAPRKRRSTRNKRKSQATQSGRGKRRRL